MTLPVRQRRSAVPELLADRYRDPPDGVRVNMILSLDGAAAVDGKAAPSRMTLVRPPVGLDRNADGIGTS